MKPYPKTTNFIYYSVIYNRIAANGSKGGRRHFHDFEKAVSWAEKRFKIIQWFEFKKNGWSNSSKDVRLAPSNNRIVLAHVFIRRPRKRTIGRRKAIIESLELRPDVTWEEIISALEIRDETSFQIRLAELRRTP